jgi:co-chaperonin GroES (HSP10)
VNQCLSVIRVACHPAARAIVKRIEEQEQKSAGGIITPATAKEKPHEGKVMASVR